MVPSYMASQYQQSGQWLLIGGEYFATIVIFHKIIEFLKFHCLYIWPFLIKFSQGLIINHDQQSFWMPSFASGVKWSIVCLDSKVWQNKGPTFETALCIGVSDDWNCETYYTSEGNYSSCKGFRSKLMVLLLPELGKIRGQYFC